MTNTTRIVIAVAALVVAVGIGFISRGLLGPTSGSSLGAAGGLLAENYWPYLLYNDGYKSEREIVLSGANGDVTSGDDITAGDDLTVTDDATVSGGALTVTTAANATSTLVVGRTQTYATSSATQICLDFNTQATTTIAGTANGVVTWKYGACN